MPKDFYSHAPRGARLFIQICINLRTISTHTPLAGRDVACVFSLRLNVISTHTPLAGRDENTNSQLYSHYISTHTPLAGRDN